MDVRKAAMTLRQVLRARGDEVESLPFA